MHTTTTATTTMTTKTSSTTREFFLRTSAESVFVSFLTRPPIRPSRSIGATWYEVEARGSFVTADSQIICINTRRSASRNEDIKGSHIDQTAVSPRAVQFPSIRSNSVHLAAAAAILSLQPSHPTGPSYILTITWYRHSTFTLSTPIPDPHQHSHTTHHYRLQWDSSAAAHKRNQDHSRPIASSRPSD